MSIQAMKMAADTLELVKLKSDPKYTWSVINTTLTALRAAITEAERQEPVAWMFQHDETCRTMCVDAWQVENGFEKMNPRLQKIGPLYTTPQPAIPAWQPIETAPQEWGSYLVWHPKYGMETLWFQLKDGGNDGRKAGNWYAEEGDDDYPCNARVTHWMPLPAAPKEMK